jgi:hypothetical protein
MRLLIWQSQHGMWASPEESWQVLQEKYSYHHETKNAFI